MFLLLILSLNRLLLISVSRVLPDFEIIMNKLLLKFMLVFISSIFNWSKLSRKVNFFEILYLKNEYKAFAPKTEPPIPIRITNLYLLNFIS